MRQTLFSILLLTGLLATGCRGTSLDPNANNLPEWAFGGFVRPEGKNPIISPDTVIKFNCPMQDKPIGWMESDTFNPAATIKDGKVYVLFRAEDNSAMGVGRRTSRIGLAESHDGIAISLIRDTPVMYPDNDNMKEYEWPGGCEDPRVTMTEDGTYVMAYTSWDRKIPRLCIATSKDLINWSKHGYAFEKACDGRFKEMKCKSGSIVTKVVNGIQVITKIDGKYMMYWGEKLVNIATSNNLIDWIPQLTEDGELKGVIHPRNGYFDSSLTECGPPAIVTEHGILLLYNGKNRTDDKRDERFAAGTYSAGQVLFDLDDPSKVIGRLDVPFFRPMDEFEKSGQYRDGTVFIEGLVYHNKKWFLYYGCADSEVAVAVYDPATKIPGDKIN